MVTFSHLDQLPVATLVGAEESSHYRFRFPFRFQKRLCVLVSVVALQWRDWYMLKWIYDGVMKDGIGILSSAQEITMGLEIYG